MNLHVNLNDYDLIMPNTWVKGESQRIILKFFLSKEYHLDH